MRLVEFLLAAFWEWRHKYYSLIDKEVDFDDFEGLEDVNNNPD